MAPFLTLWLGQTVSLLGSGMTAFALGIWAYQSSGSVTRFGLLTFCATFPMIVAAPLAGALIDRWDRRRALLLSDLGGGLGSLALVLLFWGRVPQLWEVCLVAGIKAAFATFQVPAVSAAIPLLVRGEDLPRANGLFEVGNATASLLAPLLAGLLMVPLEIRGVLLADCASFAISLASLLFLRIRRPPEVTDPEAQGSGFLGEVLAGFRFLGARRGLLALLALFGVINFSFGALQTLLTPLVLSFAAPRVLGTILSVAGLGMLAGGATLVAWGGPRRRIRAILALVSLQGVLLLLGGLKASALLIGAVAFLFMFCGALTNATSQTLWQRKVELGLQGRVFAVRRMAASFFLPLAYLVSGPLADRVFIPLLEPAGPLAGTLGRLLGTGPGRGVGLLFMTLGTAILTAAALAWRYRPLRDLERALPDVGNPLPATPG